MGATVGGENDGKGKHNPPRNGQWKLKIWGGARGPVHRNGPLEWGSIRTERLVAKPKHGRLESQTLSGPVSLIQGNVPYELPPFTKRIQ